MKNQGSPTGFLPPRADPALHAGDDQAKQQLP